MAKFIETVFPRVFTILTPAYTKAAGGNLTIAQVLAGPNQPIAVEEMIVTTNQVTEDNIITVSIFEQDDDGTFTTEDYDPLIANPGARSFLGTIRHLATVEPTPVALGVLLHSEVVRTGVTGYMRFIPGSTFIFAGQRFGFCVNDAIGGIIYTVKIVCSYI